MSEWGWVNGLAMWVVSVRDVEYCIKRAVGERKTVTLVEIAGNQVISGGNGLGSGRVDPAKIPSIISDLVAKGFNHAPQVIDLVLFCQLMTLTQ
jgi:hypothetical protein